MKALIFNSFGGPEVLQYKEIDDPIINDNEVLVKMKAIGLNYADIYRRKGNYHLEGNPPYILGYEGAGVVEKVGKNIKDIKIGDHIGFADVPYANAEFVKVPQDKIIPIPSELTFDIASSLLLQGLTAHYLTKDSFKIKKDDVVLVHAAAGGVGQLLVQICKLLGGKVIGLTSSIEKSTVCKSLGADFTFLYNEPWCDRVKEVTNGLGVNVVYDSVGSTLEESFNATKIGGTVVFFGMSGGDPVKVDPKMLMNTSKTITGGDLWNVLTSYEERKKRSSELFSWVLNGNLKVSTPQKFSLQYGKKAHELLESRKSTGKILLIP